MRRLPIILALLATVILCAAVCAGAEELPDWYLSGAEAREVRFGRMDAMFDCPCVYILTEDSQPILSRDEYVPAVIDVIGGGEEFRLTAEGGVKVRGNSTATMDEEKPYRIRIQEVSSGRRLATHRHRLTPTAGSLKGEHVPIVPS